MTPKTQVIEVTDIKWDTDGEPHSLPQNIVMEVDLPDPVDEEIEDLVSDRLSDDYGFCHKGFCWRVRNRCRECDGKGTLQTLGGDWGKTKDGTIVCWACEGKGVEVIS